MKKKIIILTKSIKHTGYCVAGIDYDTGKWIRLISSDKETEGAVPEQFLYYSDGSMLDVYDVIECELRQPCPTVVQPENWLYNEDVAWKKIGVSCLEHVLEIHGYDRPEYVFYDSQVSLANNWNFKGEGSLCLLNVEDAYVWVKTFDGKQTVSLNFTYNGYVYKYMRISQMDIKDYYSNKSDGAYPIYADSIVFSLTDRYYYNGKYYKVVAQILD